jgi:hypothetical protein
MGDYSLLGHPHSDAPPPYDLCPYFPTVYFNQDGEPYLGGPGDIPDAIIHQIVPSPCNPYIRRFGGGGYRDWGTPDAVHGTIMAAQESGLDITIYSRRPHVRVAGTSRGRPRFLQGSGVSVFVVRELGPLPNGGEICGSSLWGMVVMFGIVYPNPDDRLASIHIFPAEYLVDSTYPGLPAGLSPAQLNHWLPPPPIFILACPVAGVPGLFHTQVAYDISDKEVSEGGGTICSYTLRGRSYSQLLSSAL